MNDKNIDLNSIETNYREILDNVSRAAERAGRDASEIKIVAVTKTHSPEVIDAGIRAGISIIGESKVQEAEKKLPQLKEKYQEFHFIGHLQKNKINKLLSLEPALIHSIDKISTAKALNNALEREDRQQKILIQINTSGEESKFGLPADQVIIKEFVRQVSLFERLEISGLMTIGKFTDDRKEIRQCFSLLRQYFESLKEETIPGVKMEILSMGMTEDYEIAVEEGATMLRIGTAIFGQRLEKGL
ncbi:MAG: YggS family pyridoxal phosphate-dependent enzyme [Candidatus Cloacimonetes bacterium]|nr:YggS family pyridoxal phosphate-dependent enzyme [Candidatus Cloacimonadota bacterium]